jgi:hypothetical protein
VVGGTGGDVSYSLARCVCYFWAGYGYGGQWEDPSPDLAGVAGESSCLRAVTRDHAYCTP